MSPFSQLAFLGTTGEVFFWVNKINLFSTTSVKYGLSLLS